MFVVAAESQPGGRGRSSQVRAQRDSCCSGGALRPDRGSNVATGRRCRTEGTTVSIGARRRTVSHTNEEAMRSLSGRWIYRPMPTAAVSQTLAV